MANGTIPFSRKLRSLLVSLFRREPYGLNDLHVAPEQCGFSHPRLVVLVLDRTRRTDLEWFRFIVIDTPELSTALVAQQIEGDLWPAVVPQGRTYKGFWTFDPAKVRQIVGILSLAARILVEETGLPPTEHIAEKTRGSSQEDHIRCLDRVGGGRKRQGS